MPSPPRRGGPHACDTTRCDLRLSADRIRDVTGRVAGSDPFTALLTEEHDAHVLWLPVAEPVSRLGPTVLTGGRVLAVAADHPLAERGTPRRWKTSATTMSSTSAPKPPNTGSRRWSPRVRRSTAESRSVPLSPTQSRRADFPRDSLAGRLRTVCPPATTIPPAQRRISPPTDAPHWRPRLGGAVIAVPPGGARAISLAPPGGGRSSGRRYRRATVKGKSLRSLL